MAKKNRIVEEYKKRFKEICEMTVLNGNGNVDEAGGDDQGQDAGGGDPMGGGMPPMGGDPSMGGGMPPMGGDPSMGGGMPPMGGDPSQGGQQQGPEGFNPQVGGDQGQMGGMDPSMGGGDPSQMGGDPSMGGMDPSMMGGDPSQMGGDVPQADDDVVDISQLTDAQEQTKEEVSHLDSKFGEIMKHIGAFEELLRRNDEKIEDLKAEFEKRNPTQIEKLGLQTTKSYPFNITPDDFWKQKEATSNYSTEPDNNGKGQGQYVITKDDVNGAVDWKGISDSLDDDDFIYNQTLDGVLKI